MLDVAISHAENSVCRGNRARTAEHVFLIGLAAIMIIGGVVAAVIMSNEGQVSLSTALQALFD